jgi:hypothetical protein
VTGKPLSSPAAERNKDPILAVLKSVLPASGSLLEIASGTGQHVCHFASHLPAFTFQPTEPDAESRAAMLTRIHAAALTNVRDPVALDVHNPSWPGGANWDAVLCINMIHISPWSATDALCRGAAHHLRVHGLLVLYGPYLEDGTAAPSNLDFDASLKRRNADWGLRELQEVTRVAASHGLVQQKVEHMPANNLTVVFGKPS